MPAALVDRSLPLVMVLLGLPFAFKVGRRGSLYGVGVALLLVLVYWATFAAMLKPLPPELCPMSDAMRGAYGSIAPRTEAALDDALIAHRDRIYERHLELPLDF